MNRYGYQSIKSDLNDNMITNVNEIFPFSWYLLYSTTTISIIYICRQIHSYDNRYHMKTDNLSRLVRKHENKINGKEN